MNYIILQQTGGGGMLGALISFAPLLLIFVVFYFFMMRPQIKKQKEQEAFKNSIQKGDMVVTTGGIHGKVAELRENQSYFLLEIESGHKIRIERSAISGEFTAIAYPKTAANATVVAKTA
jgi:preprotein translocase subunit YajC